MYRQEPLSLPHTFKSTHDPLSNSRRLMGKFCPVISILTCIVNRIRDEVSMCDPIASQLVRHYLSGFHSMCLQQPFEEALSGLAVASTLQKNIDDFAILIDSAP